MRPAAVLNAIIFGSAAAITFGLTGVLIIFLVLKGDHPQMRTELPALLRSSMVFAVLTAVSAASLYALLKGLKWRWAAQVGMWLVIGGIAVLYWPR
jgi:uncharacterized membrane protein YfcA